jgi:hypothetical protein
MDWGALAQMGLSMASNYANSRQQGRQQAAQFSQGQNTQAVAQNNSQNNVLLQMAQIELLRKQMQEQNRPQRAQATALGDALANVQDARVSAPSHITRFNVSGGMRPSALGPNARRAGAELSNQSLAALLEGDSFMPIKPRGPVNLDANMPDDPSTFENIMGLAGTAGNAYDAYQQRQIINQLMPQTQGTPAGVQGGANGSYQDAIRRLFGNDAFTPTHQVPAHG